MQIKNGKKELRAFMRNKRKYVENKAEYDEMIFKNLISLKEYCAAKTILIYASNSEEVSTDRIIAYSLSAGKTVAVPRCRDKEGNMDFYIIRSLSDLKEGYFNLREPDVEKCKKAEDFNGAFLIVPAICFDKNGYRLGYGGGYYDRFIKKFTFISAGLCYNSLIVNGLPRENHDKSVDLIVSETEIYYCNGGKNG